MTSPATLTIRSEISQVRAAREWVGGLLRPEEWSPRGRYRLLLALTEVLTNIIRHGHHESPHFSIIISLLEEKDRVALTIQDQAPPFDPISQPLPDLTEPGEGGYGIALVRSSVDECRYEPLLEPGGAHKGNLVRLVKRKG